MSDLPDMPHGTPAIQLSAALDVFGAELVRISGQLMEQQARNGCASDHTVTAAHKAISRLVAAFNKFSDQTQEPAQ